MSFFEPEPPPSEPLRHQWAPPAWDRPSEGTVPWLVPVNAIIHQTADVIILIESVAAYPNGFVIKLALRSSPHRSPQEVMDRVHRAGMGIPRMGVRFSDGQTAGQEAASGPGFGQTQELPKDAEGFPTRPIVRFTSGGGGGGEWRFGIWVYPLPPEGPVEVFVSFPVAGLEEGSAVIDGTQIRNASQRANVVWG
jgi:hypothetical protein